MNTHWTLAQTLQKYGQKVPALVKASGVSRNTVYDIVNGKTGAVTLETLDKLLSGLEELTGARMTVEDVLRREEPADISPALLVQLANARPFNWEELQKLIPDWTDEERAENDRYWREHEEEKRAALVRDERRLQQIADLLDGPQGDVSVGQVGEREKLAP